MHSSTSASDVVRPHTAIAPQVPSDSVYTRCYCEENIYLLATAFQARPDVKDRWEISIAFISNAGKTVALRNQQANKGTVVWDYHVILILRPRPTKSESADPPVIEAGTTSSWVYDFDTQLPMPCAAKDYIARTFPFHDQLPTAYQSFFRVVPAPTYLDNFASDRSHMLHIQARDDHDSDDVQDVCGTGTEFEESRGPGHEILNTLVVAEEGPRYISPPPAYPAICGPVAKAKGIKTNLMEAFVHMSTAGGGDSTIEDVETYGRVFDLQGFLSWST